MKRSRQTHNGQPPLSHEECFLLSLPGDVLLLLLRLLTPRERQPARLACSKLAEIAAQTSEVFTLSDDMAQHMLNDPAAQRLPEVTCRRPVSTDAFFPCPPTPSSPPAPETWLARILGKFPQVRRVGVKCHSHTLSLMAGSLLMSPSGAARLHEFARAAEHEDTWHAAAMYGSLVKFHISQSSMEDALDMVASIEMLEDPARSLQETHVVWLNGFQSCHRVLSDICAEACSVTQARSAFQAFFSPKRSYCRSPRRIRGGGCYTFWCISVTSTSSSRA